MKPSISDSQPSFRGPVYADECTQSRIFVWVERSNSLDRTDFGGTRVDPTFPVFSGELLAVVAVVHDDRGVPIGLREITQPVAVGVRGEPVLFDLGTHGHHAAVDIQ